MFYGDAGINHNDEQLNQGGTRTVKPVSAKCEVAPSEIAPLGARTLPTARQATYADSPLAIIGLKEALSKRKPRPEPLVEDLLRVGQKMMIAGAPKIGKTYFLIALSICVAEGQDFLGHKCRQGRVIYLNYENDEEDLKDCFEKVYCLFSINRESIENIEICSLMGETESFHGTVDNIIAHVANEGSEIALIVVDPLYMALDGDENSNLDAKLFCKELDRLCRALGCAVALAHHQNKSAPGQVPSMYRFSGSNVFIRYINTFVDLSIIKATRSQLDAACDALARFFIEHTAYKHGLALPGVCTDTVQTANDIIEKLDPDSAVLAERWFHAIAANDNPIALRMTVTERSFGPPKPTDIVFCHPVFVTDEAGALSGRRIFGEAGSGGDNADQRLEDFEEAFRRASKGRDFAYIADVAKELGVSEKTVYRRAEEHSGFAYKDKKVFPADD